MPGEKTIFVCEACGRESPKWLGRCPNCQAWNSFTEKVSSGASAASARVSVSPPETLSRVPSLSQERISIALPELNRVLGGGLVPGSMVLIAGDPGIGKSTLLLQIASLAGSPDSGVLYVSGEETPRQIKLRADRLSIKGEGLYLFSETDLEVILSQIEKVKPNLVIIDSIQSVYIADETSGPGSITQVRECTLRLMQLAKLSNIPIFISGHVTKEGAIAGPRVLEHIVDVVLYLEGEPGGAFRILRGVKNRFGTVSEVGVFEMKERGLIEVTNPSEVFLSERQELAVGSVVVPVLEGNRPLLVEIQGLTNPTSFGLPRRTANGIDFNRLLLIIAVLSRRVGLRLGNQDVMVNVTGGLKVSEPAADLGVALAITSSFRDSALDPNLAAIGEVGLSGEVRGVRQLERRLGELARLGFKRVIVARTGVRDTKIPGGMRVIPVASLREAIGVAWGEASPPGAS
ncbi:MAG: DNA repair protein RadA, partial [Chloroflexota bacterium]